MTSTLAIAPHAVLPDQGLLDLAASIVRPRARQRPSEWAIQHVRISAKESERSGDFEFRLPFQRAVLDLPYEEPWKQGIMAYKGSQIGFSLIQMIMMMQQAVERGGPMLYMIGKADKAEEMSDRRFKELALGCAPFRACLADKMFEVEGWNPTRYDRGNIDWYGAGSPSNFVSNPYRIVVGDEFQLILANTRGWTGDPVNQLLGRIKQFRESLVVLFGHPTVEGSPFDEHFTNLSDQRAWVWDCPHCKGPVRLTLMDQVEIPLDSDGKPNPRGARLLCPCCGDEITDAQRVRAMWERSERHPEGSGRFETQLSDEDARGKAFIGLELHGLAVEPTLTVRKLAQLYVASVDDAAKQSFYNMIIGQKYRPARKRVTMTSVEACAERLERESVPGLAVPGGVRFVTAGVDVQFPESNPILYVVMVAWCASGKHFVWRRKMQGWTSLHAWAIEASVKTHGVGLEPDGRLPLETMCIDAAGKFNGQVKDQCRIAQRTCYHKVGSQLVSWIPVMYDPRMTSSEVPVQRVTKESRIVDPQRPELGPIEMYEAYRHYWVNRNFNALAEENWRFVDGVDGELKAHMMANLLQPLKKRHGMEEERVEWMLARGLRDDWARALDYAMIAAFVKHRLDRIHELDAPIEVRTPERRETWADREHNLGHGFTSGDDWFQA